jgi:hypothetical protein
LHLRRWLHFKNSSPLIADELAERAQLLAEHFIEILNEGPSISPGGIKKGTKTGFSRVIDGSTDA